MESTPRGALHRPDSIDAIYPLDVAKLPALFAYRFGEVLQWIGPRPALSSPAPGDNTARTHTGDRQGRRTGQRAPMISRTTSSTDVVAVSRLCLETYLGR